MDLAMFSPRKLRLLDQSSPKISTRKRSLFPSNSPQSNDLGLISELFSEDSDVYSPPLLSPSSSASGSPDKSLTISNHIDSGDVCQQQKSKRRYLNEMSFNEEDLKTSILALSTSTRKSPRKSSRKSFLEKENFEDNFITLLPNCPNMKKTPVHFETKSPKNLNTPKKRTAVANNKSVRRSPRSASKDDSMIKPTSFYGNLAPILATNQTNRIQGMKCVFRPSQPSRAKAKLLFEEKPSRKRERSKSMDSVREAKRRKPIFTGVHHAIPKPKKYTPPPTMPPKQESIREKAVKLTDLSRTPYRIKKTKQEGWEYTLRFTKPMRYEESPNLGEKRKFFKTSVRDSPSLSPGSTIGIPPSISSKKRKLLDTRETYLDKSPEKLLLDAADILDLIEDQESEKLQDKPEVEDILLRLEEDDEEERKRESEKQMLMNILEDSPTKVAAIESLSNCTASLDLNDSFSGSGCSRFILEDTKENQSTPQRTFPIFRNSPHNGLTDVTNNQVLSTKKKWRGVGEHQLQIDAGQTKFGARQCPDCGMVYQIGEAEDEMQHQSFHNKMTALRHVGWKNENVVGSYGSDYVLVITGSDHKVWQQKALEVIALVDKSLGITSALSTVMHNQKVFLYIADKHIVGCMVASPVTRAYKMMSSESDVDICSEESFPVRCGVSRMWTLFSHRRQGVATRLLDTLRLNFMYGNILSQEDIAFSIPTSDGKQFATKYTGSPNYFVYVGY